MAKPTTDRLITVIQGDYDTLTVTITDENEQAIDITGTTVSLTVKKLRDLSKLDDTDAIITQDVTTHLDGPAGQTQFVLTPSDTNQLTGDYQRNMRIIYTDSSFISTTPGIFRITSNPTQRSV